MQSGKFAPKWLLTFENVKPIFFGKIDSWVSGGDTVADNTMVFASKDLAIEFAKKQGYSYKVIEVNNIKTAAAKNYSDVIKKDPTL